MSKYFFGGIVVCVSLVFPLRAILAVSGTPAGQTVVSIVPVARQLLAQNTAVTVQGRVYTDKKNGFTLTLPTNWKTLPATSGSLFNAQPIKNSTSQLLIASTKYTSQKEANNAAATLTKEPNKYGQAILNELRDDFPEGDCSLKSVGKKTMGSNIGGRANVDCTLGTSHYMLVVFSFVRKLTYYSIIYLIPTKQFSQIVAQFDNVAISLKFTK